MARKAKKDAGKPDRSDSPAQQENKQLKPTGKPYSMNQLDQVRIFHEASDCIPPDKPTVIDKERRVLRIRLLLEEVLELAEASNVTVAVPKNGIMAKVCLGDFSLTPGIAPNEDTGVEFFANIADALGDILYVAHGAVLDYGLAPVIDRVFEAIQVANMTKDFPAAGTGKVGKGKNYVGPDSSIRSIISEALE